MAKKTKKFEVTRKQIIETLDEIINDLQMIDISDMTIGDIESKYESLADDLSSLRDDVDSEAS